MPDETLTPAPDVPTATAPEEPVDYQAYKASRQPAPPVPEPVAPVVTPEPAAPVPVPPQPADGDIEHPDGTPEDKLPKPGHPDTRTPTQKRIDQMTRKLRDTEREANRQREEAARLRGRLEVLEAARTPAPAPPSTAPAPAGTVATADAMPDDPKDPKPDIATYETYEAGVEATARWVARQEFKALRAAEQREAQTKAEADRAKADAETRAKEAEGYRAKADAFRAEHADWDAVVNQDLPLSDVMTPLILASPIGPAISYYLGQHPDECRALAALTGPAAYVAMGKLEAKLEAQSSAPAAVPASVPSAPVAPTPPPTPVSHAPAPITPVRGAPMPAPAEESDFQAYKRRRKAGAPV